MKLAKIVRADDLRKAGTPQSANLSDAAARALQAISDAIVESPDDASLREMLRQFLRALGGLMPMWIIPQKRRRVGLARKSIPLSESASLRWVCDRVCKRATHRRIFGEDEQSEIWPGLQGWPPVCDLPPPRMQTH
jgi:hypothetical protein